MLKTAPVCHTWPIFALFWQLTFRRRSFARNFEVLLVFFRKLHSYINQKFSYYCHFLHWQRPFKILLCVVSVNESCIPISIKIFLTIATSYTGRDRSRFCYVLLALMKVAFLYQSKSFLLLPLPTLAETVQDSVMCC
jgi:hypothetical protein